MAFSGTPISEINGVGKTRAAQLQKLGINTTLDLAYLFPRAYEFRGDVKTVANCSFDSPVSLILTVGTAVRTAKIKNRLTISKFRAFDESGSIEVVFFNSPFVKDIFHIGDVFRFYGRVSLSGRQLQLGNPKYEPYLEAVPFADIVPVYPGGAGLSNKVLTKIISSVLDGVASSLVDPLPEYIRIKNALPSLSFALRNVHFPKDENALSSALKRMAFDEMLLFGLGISLTAHYKSKGFGIKFSPCSLKPLTDLLPYELTGDQKSAVNDIYRDTVHPGKEGYVTPMARILVGDVGSGKTVCALMAIYLCVKSGYQAALMVPTEILARQHFADATALFSKLGIRVELLVGATTKKEKTRIYKELEEGELSVVIGTHALISEKVAFCNLGLVITDEQHRFGAIQRSLLKEKSKNAHLLVMSATPIPRTLALALYGDLDISKITEMPKGRTRVETYVVDESYRQRIYNFIKNQTALGGQCYIVCPAIEKSEEDGVALEPGCISTPFASRSEGLKNVVEYTEQIKKALPELKIETLHGGMKADQKDEIMGRFAKGLIDVLVSTTVIEVGVNVPNASLMIVENADRFGLSQLHQLRGRVGRGTRKSYCILVSDSKGESAKERLEIMKTTYDGYAIADKDLAMRGPGDFFMDHSGTSFRQSGGFSLKFAKLCDDPALMTAAFSAAKAIAESDPELLSPENSGLKLLFDEKIKSDNSYIS